MNNAFDIIMEHCPFLKNIIESKISEEVEKAKAEKEREIKELKASIEGLTATLLMGGK